MDGIPMGRDFLQSTGRWFRGRLEAADYRFDFPQARLEGSDFVNSSTRTLPIETRDGALKGRTSPKQPGANLLPPSRSAGPAPARYAIGS